MQPVADTRPGDPDPPWNLAREIAEQLAYTEEWGRSPFPQFRT
jgi:hypothetical protein